MPRRSTSSTQVELLRAVSDFALASEDVGAGVVDPGVDGRRRARQLGDQLLGDRAGPGEVELEDVDRRRPPPTMRARSPLAASALLPVSDCQ